MPRLLYKAACSLTVRIGGLLLIVLSVAVTFGQDGVQRVVELLQGELRIALGLSGAGTVKALDRSFIRPAWKAYKPGAAGGSASR